MSTLLGSVIAISWAAAIISEAVDTVQSWSKSFKPSPPPTQTEESKTPAREMKENTPKPDARNFYGHDYYKSQPYPEYEGKQTAQSQEKPPNLIEHQTPIREPFARHAALEKPTSSLRNIEAPRSLQPVFLLVVTPPLAPRENEMTLESV